MIPRPLRSPTSTAAIITSAMNCGNWQKKRWRAQLLLTIIRDPLRIWAGSSPTITLCLLTQNSYNCLCSSFWCSNNKGWECLCQRSQGMWWMSILKICKVAISKMPTWGHLCQRRLTMCKGRAIKWAVLGLLSLQPRRLELNQAIDLLSFPTATTIKGCQDRIIWCSRVKLSYRVGPAVPRPIRLHSITKEIPVMFHRHQFNPLLGHNSHLKYSHNPNQNHSHSNKIKVNHNYSRSHSHSSKFNPKTTTLCSFFLQTNPTPK